MSASIALHAGSLERRNGKHPRTGLGQGGADQHRADFLRVFLLLPLGTVFAEGLRKGWGAYFDAMVNRDAWDAAIKLTLITRRSPCR
jgi:hypothetical protein